MISATGVETRKVIPFRVTFTKLDVRIEDVKISNNLKIGVAMRILYRVVLVIACFFSAIACCAFAIPAGGAIFLMLDLAFETMFWLGVWSKKN